ncbi:hypothetical protein [Tateyamaria pelophila]|uniref:hypothetical protein n=1 Tax=Tateyamaria pelophila TaxID=328415 RepID=UPI001CBF165B|nr:hypothetical protein [Tateyamaria pelophila]
MRKKVIVAINPDYFQIVGLGLSAERTIVLTSLRTFPRGFVGCFDTSQVQDVAIAIQTSPFLAFRLLRHLPRANFPRNSVTVREG